jgi:gas vesicle structural protein
MAIERTTGGASVIDVLDRVLDKGIVIDAWVHLSLVGIDLITVEARVGVASIDTYLKYSESVAQVPAVSRTAAVISQEAVLAENAALRAPSRPHSRAPRRPVGRGGGGRPSPPRP